MSLMSHWRERKQFLGRNRGKPIWWLVLILALVFLAMYKLSRFEHLLPR